jgi:glycosyltransferase involved in cell wall biosynthesis
VTDHTHGNSQRTPDHLPVDVAMIMLNNSSVGGAERRFAQVFMKLRFRKLRVVLILNQSLMDRLVECDALASDDDSCVVLPEPVGWLLRHLMPSCSKSVARWRQAVRFVLMKLDYVIGAAIVTVWLLRRRPRLMHLILGGAYVALPAQSFRAAPAAILSVTNPSLSNMVGSPMALPLFKRALRQARFVDALTEEIGHRLLREGVLPQQLSISQGSCVNIERFRPASQKLPWVVFCGRFIPDKNPELFVESCALVHKQVLDRQGGVRFYLLGQGPLESHLQALVLQRGLTFCTQIGWHEQVERILGQALIFVSLQRTDNYPSQALLEAMACGAAVVATDVGLTWKLVDPTIGKRVIASPEIVAQAILDLLDHPERAVVMGRCARDRVMHSHSVESYLDYLETLYQRACSPADGSTDRSVAGVA